MAHPVELRTPDGVVAYRGALRSTMSDTGSSLQRVTVNVVPLEAYVKGVVPREVIASLWQPQALRAQAVAARTYAAYERATTNRTAFDLCDTAACQVYGGYSAEYPASNDAVVATARQGGHVPGRGHLRTVLRQQRRLDRWPDPEYPYLPAKADPYDEATGQYYGWTTTRHRWRHRAAVALDREPPLDQHRRARRQRRPRRASPVGDLDR